MTQIKHISFDVWNTLLFPNKDFAFYRTNYIRNVLLNASVPFNDIKQIYTKTKNALDQEAEQCLPAPTTLENWVRFCDSLPNSKYTTAEDVQTHVVTVIEELVRLHPPSIPSQTVIILKQLKEAGYTLSITSNTNFISGRVLFDIIRQEVGPGIFSFALFSDETGWSKPSTEMFDDVFNRTSELYLPHITFRDEILHVGDNYICDVQGAFNANMYALHCTKLEDMYEELNCYINNPLRK